MGYCPTCNYPHCNCPWGWQCVDLDCGGTQGGAGTFNWYSSGTIRNTEYPFIHQRHAECNVYSIHNCPIDKDNRFYFWKRSWMNDTNQLQIKYSGGKDWRCWKKPSFVFLTMNNKEYVRVSTGEYCPTNQVRLVRIQN